jgi:hypothetical protein
MKLTQSKLKKIIMQEAKNILREGGSDSPYRLAPRNAEEHSPFNPDDKLEDEEQEDWSGHGTEPSDKQYELHSLYSDMYKERNNVRPRWHNAGDYSAEEWQKMIDELQNEKYQGDDYSVSDFDEDEINYGSDEFGYDDHPHKRSEPFGSYRKDRDQTY